MDAPFSSIPWNTPALWREANASLEHALSQNMHAMGEPRRLARQLAAQLTSIFPLMDQLCRTTCPACTDICCQHAWVWIDFTDLLFSHLAAVPVPDGQLLNGRGEHCRYSHPGGCRLDRIQRPFVCTRYLCPAQTRYLRGKPPEMQKAMDCLERIKHLRREMERKFIRVVTDQDVASRFRAPSTHP